MNVMYNTQISKYYGNNVVAGEVGIEVETEGFNLPGRLQYHWDVHNDGSLRPAPGGVALEYVLRRPVDRANVAKVLKYLYKNLVAEPARVVPSPRCSVHVHLNQSTRTFQEVYKIICTYFIVEELLVDWCGSDRVANMFCLRAKDTDYLVNELSTAARSGGFNRLGRDGELRYAALNTSALRKYGSLEFRSLSATISPDRINTWVSALLELQDNALNFADPHDIINQFSGLGPMRFIKTVLPNYWEQFARPGWDNSMFQGMRIAQDIAFSQQRWEPVSASPKPSEAGDAPEIVDTPEDVGGVRIANVRDLHPDAFVHREDGDYRIRWAHIPQRITHVQVPGYGVTVRQAGDRVFEGRIVDENTVGSGGGGWGQVQPVEINQINPINIENRVYFQAPRFDPAPPRRGNR